MYLYIVRLLDFQVFLIIKDFAILEIKTMCRFIKTTVVFFTIAITLNLGKFFLNYIHNCLIPNRYFHFINQQNCGLSTNNIYFSFVVEMLPLCFRKVPNVINVLWNWENLYRIWSSMRQTNSWWWKCYKGLPIFIQLCTLKRLGWAMYHVQRKRNLFLRRR